MKTVDPVTYFNEGMRVWIPWRSPEHPRAGLRCVVVAAHGFTARVVNEAYGVDRWVDLRRDEVFWVRETDE